MDFGLICGDFNTTLDIKNNIYGYTTDTNKKCRSTIQNWLETDEMINAVRSFHPDTPLYFCQTKNLGGKGRVDNL